MPQFAPLCAIKPQLAIALTSVVSALSRASISRLNWREARNQMTAPRDAIFREDRPSNRVGPRSTCEAAYVRFVSIALLNRCELQPAGSTHDFGATSCNISL